MIDKDEEEIVAKVQSVHEQLNHASSYAMIRIITADPGAFDRRPDVHRSKS